jgi:hypothetical protein
VEAPAPSLIDHEYILSQAALICDRCNAASAASHDCLMRNRDPTDKTYITVDALK